MDTDNSMQIAIFKKMSPAQKIKMCEALIRSAFILKMKWLKSLHPDWSPAHVENETKKIFLYART